MELFKINTTPNYNPVINKGQELTIKNIINNLDVIKYDFSSLAIKPKWKLRYYEVIEPERMYINIKGSPHKILYFAVTSKSKLIMSVMDSLINVTNYEVENIS